MDSACVKDPNSFWEYVKKLGPTKKQSIPWEAEINGQITNNKSEVLEKWRSEFEKLYNGADYEFDEDFKNKKLEETNTIGWDISDGGQQEQLNCAITLTEVEHAVAKCKNKKAVGLDNIANELLRDKNVVRLLHSLFQVCFDGCVIPDIWKKAIIHPIPKTKEPSMDPLKHRGLALQSCIFKVFCTVLNVRIMNFLDENDVLDEEQNGFCRQRLCQQHIFSLLTVLKNECQIKKKEVFTSFVDFLKAFNSIDRELMVSKMKLDSIVGPMLNMIQHIYGETWNILRLNERFAPVFRSSKGVLQGNTISPTIFCEFINGLIQEIKSMNLGIEINNNRKISILAYADDIVLIVKREGELQDMLNVVHRWCRQWRVVVNVNKTKIIHFRSKKKVRTSVCFKLNEQNPIEVVENYKYLGISLYENLEMSKTVSELCTTASRALGMVIGKTKTNYDLSYRCFTRLYESCVTPIMMYAAGAWGVMPRCLELEKVQHRAARYFCGLPKKTALLGLVGEIGRMPIAVRKDLELLRMFNQITMMSNN